MDLNALTDFALVATNGGLGKASRASGRSKATLSRRVAELEEQLGVRLIERSARGLKLTEAGQLLIDRTEGPMHEVADAMTSAREGLSVPRGRLRIASPVLFSQLAMGRICAEFCAAYPDVTCEVVADDRLVDLVEEQFDAAIRINPGPDSSLVGRCFAKDRLVVVAAPSVPVPNARQGQPRSRHRVNKLSSHELDARRRAPCHGADPEAETFLVPDDSRRCNRRRRRRAHSAVHRVEPADARRTGSVGHGFGRGGRALGAAYIQATSGAEGSGVR
jgi:DNA-binding transcriptional LysR family regulator